MSLHGDTSNLDNISASPVLTSIIANRKPVDIEENISILIVIYTFTALNYNFTVYVVCVEIEFIYRYRFLVHRQKEGIRRLV